jgi:hypothetical protein
LLGRAVRGMDERGELTTALERQLLGLELPGSIHWEPAAPARL